ncbi:MAG: SemiSWEET transporter [Parafilimonas sp.]
MPADFFSNENIVLTTGIVAGILTAASMMPQVFKTIKTKKADHISTLMLIILIAGVSLWVVYGCIKKDWPIIITNCFSVLINLTMLFLRWRYRGNK